MLIVDDQPDIRLLVATRLGIEPGLEVAGEAADGAEAIVLARRLDPQAIVLDLQMPRMSGAEALPMLRSLVPDARIVVFSAYVGVQALRGPIQPDAAVAKGAELRVLVDTLTGLLELRPPHVTKIGLGLLPTAETLAALDRWAALRPGEWAAGAVREGGAADLQALHGVFLRLGDDLNRARAEGPSQVEVSLRTRVDAAAAARRALSAIPPGRRRELGELGRRLLATLPEALAEA